MGSRTRLNHGIKTNLTEALEWPNDHRSCSDEHTCGGALQREDENELQLTIKCGRWLQRHVGSPWSWWIGRRSRLWSEARASTWIPVNYCGRKSVDSCYIGLPFSIPSIGMTYKTSRSFGDAQLSLGWPPSSASWRWVNDDLQGLRGIEEEQERLSWRRCSRVS
jgi:hypothetical protein